MPLHPCAAAKTLCELRDWDLSNLKINKILYIAHMIRLGLSDGLEPLVAQSFEAWDYGPVLPSVYHKAKAFGAGPVQNIFRGFQSVTEGEDFDAIVTASRITESASAGQLVAMTHVDGGAWSKHYSPGALGMIIPNEDILDEFKQRTDPSS